jgi:hypothetical protein
VPSQHPHPRHHTGLSFCTLAQVAPSTSTHPQPDTRPRPQGLNTYALYLVARHQVTMPCFCLKALALAFDRAESADTLAHPRATFDTLMRTFDTLSLNIRTSAWTPYWTRRSPASSSRLSSLTKGTCARTWTDVLHCGDLENTGIQGLNRVSTLTSFSSFPTKMSSLACANCLHNTVVHVLTVSASLHSSHHIPRPDFKHEMARRGVSESRYLAYSLSLTLSTRAPSGSLAPNTRWRRGSLDRPLLYFLDIELWGFLTRVLNAWPLPCFLDVDIDTRPSKDDLVSP